jgi:sugar O-acyltransferase (sialic acid O-acetyltransferase NeuD family)
MIYAVYGASGCGRSVAPILENQLESRGETKIVFVDDAASAEVINGLEVKSYERFLREESPKKVVIAIADGKIREKLAVKCVADDLEFFTITADEHVCMRNVIIGAGAIFSPFTTLTSNIQIGRHFHCNIGSYVEHDCVIGDYVTFAPGVKCNGNVHIDDHAYIGSGAVLKQGTPDKPLRIGAGAVVGMGAVVTKDVAAGAVVVGNPARPFEKQAS